MNKWWAYLHTSGEVKLKRYLGNMEGILEDADESPFCVSRTEVFMAKDSTEARKIAEKELS